MIPKRAREAMPFSFNTKQFFDQNNSLIYTILMKIIAHNLDARKLQRVCCNSKIAASWIESVYKSYDILNSASIEQRRRDAETQRQRRRDAETTG